MPRVLSYVSMLSLETCGAGWVRGPQGAWTHSSNLTMNIRLTSSQPLSKSGISLPWDAGTGSCRCLEIPALPSTAVLVAPRPLSWWFGSHLPSLFKAMIFSLLTLPPAFSAVAD